ncbi:hypothetical protein BDW75DRAFT_225543 [Aspergillus navahoensis]
MDLQTILNPSELPRTPSPSADPAFDRRDHVPYSDCLTRDDCIQILTLQDTGFTYKQIMDQLGGVIY